MDEIDPSKTLFDTVIFDGAANVQKGASIIAAHRPMMFTMHGAEHVVSLFFSDLMKIWQLHLFQQGYCHVYRLFGSGSMQQCYAIYPKMAWAKSGTLVYGCVLSLRKWVGTRWINVGSF